MLRREVEAIRNAAKRPKEFLNLLDAFYSTHQPIIRRALGPSLTAFAAVTRSVLDLNGIESRLMEDGRNEVLELSGTVSADELPKAIENWSQKRLNKSAEIVRSLAT